MKLVAGFFYLLLLFSCAEKTLSKNTANIHKCFRFIVENKLKEFKENIEECKNNQNQIGTTTLMMAIAKDNNDIAEALLDAGVNVNTLDQAGMTALIFAANKNNARLAQLLRRSGARIEIVHGNLSGLMMATRNSSLDLIKSLNPTPAEINLKAEDGWSAIYFAVNRADPEILTYLLERGACTHSKDSYGQKPADFAREVKWDLGVKLLKRKTKC